MLGGGAVLAIVDPVGLAVAPEAGDAIPPLVVALPVAIDPEPARGRVSPRSRHPDEVIPARVPVPVAADPLGAKAGRVDPGPLDDRWRRRFLHVLRRTVLGRREERLVHRAIGQGLHRLVGIGPAAERARARGGWLRCVQLRPRRGRGRRWLRGDRRLFQGKKNLLRHAGCRQAALRGQQAQTHPEDGDAFHERHSAEESRSTSGEFARGSTSIVREGRWRGGANRVGFSPNPVVKPRPCVLNTAPTIAPPTRYRGSLNPEASPVPLAQMPQITPTAWREHPVRE